MSRRVLPDPGVTDKIGSSSKPWQEGYFVTLYKNGQEVLTAPLDASDIGVGTLDPNRILGLLTSTLLTGVAPDRSLGAINTDAALGASDPVGRINAGTAKIQGSKIADASLPPSVLNVAVAMAVMLILGNGGGFQTDDWVMGVSGLKIGKGVFDVNIGNFLGTLKGLINIAGKFKVDANGNLVFGDAVANPTQLHGIDSNGREWWGSNAYSDAPTQIDSGGNINIRDSLQSKSSIDLGAINPVCSPPQPSHASGQFSGNLTLTPTTRGADSYYTTDGSDPTDWQNGSQTKYVATIPVILAPGNNMTVKIAGYKCGVFSPIVTLLFSGDANKVATPTASPAPGQYFLSATTMQVQLASGTAGATIWYTNDGTAPSAINRTAYVGAIVLHRGTTIIRAYATKAGVPDSAPAKFTYTLSAGGGGLGGDPGGGGGEGGGGGAGGGNPPGGGGGGTGGGPVLEL